MARLVGDAAELTEAQEALGITVDANSMSFENVVNALSVMQYHMGISGTTAEEAGRTIAGSVSAMRAAWSNLLVGLVSDSGDIGELIGNLVETIVGDGTESNLGVLGNVLPAVENVLNGIAELIAGAAPVIIEVVPGLIEQILPILISGAMAMVEAVIAVLPELLGTITTALLESAPILIEAALGLVQALITGIQQNYQLIVNAALEIAVQLTNGLLTMLPQLIQVGLDVLLALANGIAQAIPNLMPTISNVVLEIVNVLTNQETLTGMLSAALSIITELAQGLANNLPTIIDALILLVDGIINFLINPENLQLLISAALDIIIALGQGFVEAIPTLLTYLGSLITSIFTAFGETDWGAIGQNLVDGFMTGIENAWTGLKEWFTGLFGNLIDIAKQILGIASPSKVFKQIGGFTAEGFGEGFDDEFSHVRDSIESAMDFDDVAVNANISRSGSFGGSVAEQNGQIVYLLSAILEATTGGNEDVVQAISESKMGVSRRDFGRLVKSYA